MCRLDFLVTSFTNPFIQILAFYSVDCRRLVFFSFKVSTQGETFYVVLKAHPHTAKHIQMVREYNAGIEEMGVGEFYGSFSVTE